MSYYFVIVGTQDNPLFEYEFGTSKQGGDGAAHFADQARSMNQFIVHSSLDILEEVQWSSGQMYAFPPPALPIRPLPTPSSKPLELVRSRASPLPRQTCNLTTTPTRYLKHIDRFFNNYISAYVTPTNAKFLLLHQPAAPSPSIRSSSIAANPLSSATEEAVRSFFTEVHENWIKAIMNPFYRADMEVTSPVFRQRVAAAGRKYL